MGIDIVQSPAAAAAVALADGSLQPAHLDAMRNAAFEYDRLLSVMHPYLFSMALSVSRTGFSISRSDIDKLDHARAVVQDVIDSTFDRFKFISEQRRQNLIDYQNWSFISLGEDCFSRTILTQWGLKPFAELGELTLPFDLSVHNLRSIIKVLELDFADYTDPSHFKYLTDVKYCRNLFYDVTYNHEVGPEYSDDNFRKITEIYTRRIGNFRNILKNPKPLAFVLHVTNPQQTDAADLDRIHSLLGRAANRPFKLIVIRTFPHGRPDAAGPIGDKPYTMIDLPYPFADYVWHKESHCFSQPGHDFEFDIISQVKSALA